MGSRHPGRKQFLFVNFKCFLSVSEAKKSKEAKGRETNHKKSITTELYWQSRSEQRANLCFSREMKSRKSR